MKATTEPQAGQKLQTSSFLSGKAGEPFIQPKLTVNEPGDAYEQEADAIAERVMRMSDPALSLRSAPIHTLQRKCAHCKEEDKLQRKETGDTASTAPVSVQQTLNQPGQPLSAESRSFFEPRFGQDFSRVRIHADEGAAESARQINALAYTSGQNVVFGRGQYQPESASGKRLLAHELTHVVQQSGDTNTKKVSNVVQPYREKESFNFGRKDTTRLRENSFDAKSQTDKDKKPWIEKIYIHFDRTDIDSEANLVPKGNLIALYHPNVGAPALNFIGVKVPKFISLSITGGKHTEGYTTSGPHTVTRIEGVGYNDSPDAKAGEGPHKKYKKDLNSSMSFAIFFHHGEAIHSGALDIGSHGCVHVDWGGRNDTGDTETLKELNYHAVVGLTQVMVSYAPGILPKLCCKRHKYKKQKTGTGAKPCDTVKAESCGI